jgi:hypothetical protein
MICFILSKLLRLVCLAPPLFVEVPVHSQESEWLCISELWVSILPLIIIFLFDFGTLLKVFYFLFYFLFYFEEINWTFSVIKVT